MDTQTGISLGAAVVAVVATGLNVWNVNRTLSHGAKLTDRRSYQEAADTLTGLLVRASRHLHRLSELERNRPHDTTTRRGASWSATFARELERAGSTALELSTAEIVFRSRCVEGDVLATQVEEAAEAFDALVQAYGGGTRDFVSPELAEAGIEGATDRFNRRYRQWIEGVKVFRD